LSVDYHPLLLEEEIPDLPSTVLAAVDASMVMLGHWAWYVDARLFGRQRIDLQMR
jgi:hypothetical protein